MTEPIPGAPPVPPQPPMPPQPPVPQPPVPPQPQPPVPPLTPAGTPPAPQGGWKDFFRSANWVEIGVMAIGVTAFLFLIKYYRYRLYADKETNRKLQLQIDDIQAEMAKMKKPKKAPMSGMVTNFTR